MCFFQVFRLIKHVIMPLFRVVQHEAKNKNLNLKLDNIESTCASLLDKNKKTAIHHEFGESQDLINKFFKTFNQHQQYLSKSNEIVSSTSPQTHKNRDDLQQQQRQHSQQQQLLVYDETSKIYIPKI